MDSFSTLLFIFQMTFILALTKATAASFNLSFHAVFNFGDSNSDTGGLYAGKAFPLGPPNGQTFFQKPAGRFCDGRLISDFLMVAMDLPFLNPYLDSVGAPSFRNGCNFATGGSTILPVKANAISPFSFGVQVAQFIRFKAKVAELLLSNRSELQKFLPEQNDFRQGLYMFDIGQNDIDTAFNSKSDDEHVFALIPSILSEFQRGIKVFEPHKVSNFPRIKNRVTGLSQKFDLWLYLQALYNEGARNFWIHNMGPLGCLPRIIATFGSKNASKLDELGCVASHNKAAKLFNLQLRNLCVEFQTQFPEAKLAYVDIHGIKSDLIANYTRYGFKEALAACCGYGGLPLNFDTRIACGETKALNGTALVVTAEACNNTSEYVNWDGNHYTEAANKFVSSQILSGNYLYSLSIIDHQDITFNSG